MNPNYAITDINDPRYPICRITYKCSLPEAVISDRRINYGSYKLDSMLVNNYSTVYLDISTLADHFYNGVDIRIPIRGDIVKMYNAVQKYLLYYIDYVRLGPLNLAYLPTDDLLKLDNFAASLYVPAAFDVESAPVVLSSFESMLADDDIINQLMDPIARTSKEIKIPERESLEDDIFKYSLNLHSKLDNSDEMIPLSKLLEG